MKKLFLTVLIVVLITGIASAAGIPFYVDAKAGPETWITSVYNNSGGTLDQGDVVVWDIKNSTGDNDNYVTTTTTANTFLVAGIIANTILKEQVGVMVIKGPVSADCAATVAAGERVCTSGVAGEVTDAQNCQVQNAVGYALSSYSGGTCMVEVFGR